MKPNFAPNRMDKKRITLIEIKRHRNMWTGHKQKPERSTPLFVQLSYTHSASLMNIYPDTHLRDTAIGNRQAAQKVPIDSITHRKQLNHTKKGSSKNPTACTLKQQMPDRTTRATHITSAIYICMLSLSCVVSSNTSSEIYRS